MDVAGLWSLFDGQLRARVPEWPPLGAVFERDELVVRTHYGTHGTVSHPDLSADGLDELISRQVRVFAERNEPVEWVVYGLGEPADLGDRLVAAGFTAGWTRQLFLADLARINIEYTLPDGVELKQFEDVPELAAATGPHRSPFAELCIDGQREGWNLQTVTLFRRGRIVAAGWVDLVQGTDFAVIGGMTEPQPAILSKLCEVAHGRSRYPRIRGRSHILAEADGVLAELLTSAGFRSITSVTTYHLPSTRPAAHERPAVALDEPEHTRIWDRVHTDLRFVPGVESMPAIAEPAASVTWQLGALAGESAGAELERVIERGLRACVKPGEPLYWLDWYHTPYRFDPDRVGGPGQPEWFGEACPNGDYYLYLTPDLRLGTFGHPHEKSLCVFGADLLAEVEQDLTALLGKVLRRGGVCTS
ncbi:MULTISPECIES: DUF2716 domain-containing protein [unclassified Crossiella]|uniref:DUF2716 domain-containing protein n=1 Tax=unclassified Crossiella TaxID=2620835 RepID=UPI001FFF86A5|nr:MULTISPECIES: DUF2716 domain-containing protein [unclassified Crossiella]MCK2242473.1 DUF2716 domain-containing protein [Crossiella sp. S99.2]MCK2254497.1 DUF2716 domain-containing protein [Crossiella sp. S99.1]